MNLFPPFFSAKARGLLPWEDGRHEVSPKTSFSRSEVSCISHEITHLGTGQTLLSLPPLGGLAAALVKWRARSYRDRLRLFQKARRVFFFYNRTPRCFSRHRPLPRRTRLLGLGLPFGRIHRAARYSPFLKAFPSFVFCESSNGRSLAAEAFFSPLMLDYSGASRIRGVFYGNSLFLLSDAL